MIVPKTVTHWVPITCNYCAECGPWNLYNQGREDPGFNPQYVDKFCSDSHYVQDYFSGFTFALLMAAIFLSTVEFFVNRQSMRRFGKLLAKEEILETMEFSDVTEFGAVETKQRLRRCRTYLSSYRKIQAIKVISGLVFLGLVLPARLIMDLEFDVFVCDFKTYHFECLGSPGYFVEILGKESLLHKMVEILRQENSSLMKKFIVVH